MIQSSALSSSSFSGSFSVEHEPHVSALRPGRAQVVQEPRHSWQESVSTAPLPELPDDLSQCPVNREGCRCRGAARRIRATRDAGERYLAIDAFREGWFCTGGGGLPAYHRAYNMIYRDELRTRQRREVPLEIAGVEA